MTRPPLIASVNLSREDRWADTPYQFLHTFVKKRVRDGYTHIQLGRPLHKSHPAWGRVWEPLNAHEYITRAQRIALEEIVKVFPDVTFSVHLGFEWITPRLVPWFHYQRDKIVTGKHAFTFDRYSRVAGRWDNDEYRMAVIGAWDWWEDRGYRIYSEGINVIETGGQGFADHYPSPVGKPIATIPQMTRRGFITSDQPNPCMTKLDWFVRKLGEEGAARLNITAPFYLAIDQQAYRWGFDIKGRPRFHAWKHLINNPNVGILVLNGGRPNQTKHGHLYQWAAAEFGGG